MKRRLTALLLAVSLGGCSSLTNPIEGFFVGKDNTDPPAPLVTFEPSIEVSSLWTARVGAGSKKLYVKLLPAAAYGRVYAAGAKGRVTAHDAASGELVWETDTEVPISGGTGVGDKLVLVGTSEAEVLALDAENGELQWRVHVSSEVLATPKAADGVVVVRTVDGRIAGLSPMDGKRLWAYDSTVPVLSLRGASAPVLYHGAVIAGLANGKLVALRLKDGALLWETRVAVPRGRSDLERMVDIDAEPIVADGVVHVVTYQGNISTVAIQDGRVLWKRDMSSHAGIGADDRYLYVTDEQSHVWALDRRSGASLWKQDKLHARKVTAPAAYGEYVVVGDYEGYLHWLDRRDGHFVARIKVDEEGIIAPPQVVGDTVYVSGIDGTLVAVRPAKPTTVGRRADVESP